MAQSKYLIYPLYNSIVIFQFANCKRLPEGISQKTRVFEWQERVLRQTPAGWPSILKTSSFLCPFVGNPWFWATRRWPETIGHLESFYQWGLNFEWPNVQGERKSISWVAAWIPMWWFLGLQRIALSLDWVPKLRGRSLVTSHNIIQYRHILPSGKLT